MEEEIPAEGGYTIMISRERQRERERERERERGH
jgi:hypothetical protein